MDSDIEAGDARISVNLTVLPLLNTDRQKLGTLLMLEDISTEKRVKSTMARYMDPGLADQMLQGGAEILGGKRQAANRTDLVAHENRGDSEQDQRGADHPENEDLGGRTDQADAGTT